MLRKEDFEPNMKTEDKIPGAQTENPAQSQRFGDFIVKYILIIQYSPKDFSGVILPCSFRLYFTFYVSSFLS